MTVISSLDPKRKPDPSPGKGKPLPSAWSKPDPDAEATSPQANFDAACRYVAAGLSVIPIDASLGMKQPDGTRIRSWAVFQTRLPSMEEIRQWLDRGTPFGLAIVAGSVSGGGNGLGLEIIDFDSVELAKPWMDAVHQRAPGLVERLVMVESPRPGLHVYYLCSVFEGNGKLACGPLRDEYGVEVRDLKGRLKKTTLIERKGNGGYCLAPPSPRRCHPRNGLYKLVGGLDLTQVPIISPAERTILDEEARNFNRWEEPVARPAARAMTRKVDSENRPGDDFERRAIWSEILEPHGWSLERTNGDEEYWCRPGKSGGISASVNHRESGVLHVFSTNADPFEDGQSYGKFAAYALLNHDGDFKVAAGALWDLGYGKTEPMKGMLRAVKGDSREALTGSPLKGGPA